MAFQSFPTRFALIALMAGMLSLWCVMPAFAEPASSNSEETRLLLEKSLSVVEIDNEIKRVQVQQADLTKETADAKQALEEQEQQIAHKREQAGKVLRAYYMGDRDIWLTALLSSRSLSDFLMVMEYADLIFAHDRDVMKLYKEEYAQLTKGIEQLGKKQQELASIEQRLKEQRARVLTLQEQIEGGLAGRSDADKLRLMMEELTKYWESIGLYEVKQHFSALSKAMQKLPEWLQNNKQYMETSGLTYTIRIPEDALNTFLREQDERFQQFSFSFEDGSLTAHGKRDALELSVTGHYTVEQEPRNGIIFHVDELLFNGLSLPDTTKQELEKQFDLGFYPSFIVSFLQATDVEIKDGELIVTLQVKL
ncbi:hypothetical protein SAMN04487969_10132 [Paenibacillus algorifonticola]|uniref:N-terminal domain of peptidoglycan hydrolase CwlO-containing protein n=1 Tax=Paenibacillus algorifonticola TaxID=684063 RepID=A0A1I1XR30_9BACL|nr:hypothetical protein [Paenibacillus algorifonticola]SFE09775.1 hypothetical protein SAMN04487969_10132 [Paenibacillus algorifonticola]